jgi:hypothetical protein
MHCPTGQMSIDEHIADARRKVHPQLLASQIVFCL